MSRTRHHGYKQKDRFGKTDNWYKNEPKWWRKMTKHRRRRAAWKQCQHQIRKGNYDVTTPLDKKPWEYWW